MMLEHGLLVLFGGIGSATWEGGHFPHLHTDPFEKGTNLGRRPTHTRHLFNRGLGLRDRAGRFGAEGCFHTGLMRIEEGGLPGILKLFQPLDPAVAIQLHGRDERLPRHLTEACDVVMGQTVAFQIEHLHALLDMGRGVMIAFIGQRRTVGIRKIDLNHSHLVQSSSSVSWEYKQSFHIYPIVTRVEYTPHVASVMVWYTIIAYRWFLFATDKEWYMATATLEQLDTAIEHLAVVDQLWLMERLIHRLRLRAVAPPITADDLAAMAADPALQQVLLLINQEFLITEGDGLEVRA